MKTNNRLYIEDYTLQVNKKKNFICGDYTLINRTPEYTDFVLCDGMGSGPKANMSAIMCASRIITLLQNGISIYRACEKAVQLMHRARTEEVPFAAFSIARISKLGQYTILSFEIPPPIIIKGNIAEIEQQRFFTSAHEVVGESIGKLSEGDSIVLVSDGVTQAGLGIIQGMGWGIEGFCRFINIHLSSCGKLSEMADKTIANTRKLSGNIHADDTTISILTAKHADIVNILTGPPEYKGDDHKFVTEFMERTGSKIICGSTTAEVAARELGKKIEMQDISTDFNQPPRYTIDGIDIVSEGAVTLNQVYNILDVDRDNMPVDSVVGDIAGMLLDADVINIYLGTAKNAAHKDISFKQIGIVERAIIINLIVDKLKKKSKVIRIITSDMV